MRTHFSEVVLGCELVWLLWNFTATGHQRRRELWPWAWLALTGLANLAWVTGLGRRRRGSMAYWLEDLEILGCFDCRADDHTP